MAGHVRRWPRCGAAGCVPCPSKSGSLQSPSSSDKVASPCSGPIGVVMLSSLSSCTDVGAVHGFGSSTIFLGLGVARFEGSGGRRSGGVDQATDDDCPELARCQTGGDAGTRGVATGESPAGGGGTTWPSVCPTSASAPFAFPSFTARRPWESAFGLNTGGPGNARSACWACRWRCWSQSARSSGDSHCGLYPKRIATCGRLSISSDSCCKRVGCRRIFTLCWAAAA